MTTPSRLALCSRAPKIVRTATQPALRSIGPVLVLVPSPRAGVGLEADVVRFLAGEPVLPAPSKIALHAARLGRAPRNIRTPIATRTITPNQSVDEVDSAPRNASGGYRNVSLSKQGFSLHAKVAITEGLVVRRILDHLDLPSSPPPIAPARAPPEPEFAW